MSKYVIKNGRIAKTAIVFDECENHSNYGEYAVSAGFVSFSPPDEKGRIIVCAYGESFSLGLESNVKDAEIICDTLNSGIPYEGRIFFPAVQQTGEYNGQ